MKKEQLLKVGDVVAVKPNIKDPDFDVDIGGWQGRVSEISDENIICIDWDSITLKNMPYSFIAKCEEQGFGWDQFYIAIGDVESAPARDKLADVQRAVNQLSAEHAWDYLGPEGKNIKKVLTGIDPGHEWKAMKAWYTHFKQVLKFPFEAEVSEWQERGPLRSGDRVTVEGITDVDDLYGVIVQISRKRQGYHFPLCDLEATEINSANHDYLREYAVWFANR